MANQARDPWKNEYHGAYITNAEHDNGADRGAIVIYSNGANGIWGSGHGISNGVVVITVPDGNKNGKDDYAISVCYSYANGYGETNSISNGFSNNQTAMGKPGDDLEILTLEGSGQVFYSLAPAALSFRSIAPLDEFKELRVNGMIVDPSNYTLTEGSTIVTLHPEYLTTLGSKAHSIVVVSENSKACGKFEVVQQKINNQFFYYNVPYMMGTLDENGDLCLDQPIGIMMCEDGTIYCTAYDTPDHFPVWKYKYTVEGNILTVDTDGDNELVPDGLTAVISEDGKNVYFEGIGNFAMSTAVAMSEGEYFYAYCWFIMGPFVLDKTKESYSLPLCNMQGYEFTFGGTYRDCVNLKEMTLPIGAKSIGNDCFYNCVSLKRVIIPVTVTSISGSAFSGCSSLTTIEYNGTIEQWNSISKNNAWAKDIPATQVVCSDGIVTIK
jgi:hypothetical protein